MSSPGGYEETLGAENKTYIPALKTTLNLGLLFERQADLAKARIMCSKALVGYAKAVGPNHPISRRLWDKLQALDTIAENIVRVRRGSNIRKRRRI